MTLFEETEAITIRLTSGPLSGRRLVTTDAHTNLDTLLAKPAGETHFKFEKTLAIADYRATWEAECAAMLHRFFELFPGHNITTATMAHWVDRFKKRQFGG